MATVMTGNGERRLPATGFDARVAGCDEIPVLDLAPFACGAAAARQALAMRLREACIRSGFFYIRNHGIPQDVVASVFSAAKDYFALPDADKMATHVGRSRNNRGYAALLEENTDPSGAGDLHESFDIALDVPADDPDVLAGKVLYGPNQWPTGRPALRAALERYHAEMCALSHRLLAAFALSLALPEDYFEPMIRKPLATLRVLHYPPQPEVDDARRIGTGAHTDYECFTILAQDDVPALQVLSAQDEWLAAPPVPGCFLVNIGDQMARWTNDRYVSTVHRVINRTGRERYSIPFFFGPDYDTVVTALPGCVAADDTQRYAPIRSGDYINERFTATFANYGGKL
ncbi:isopenicillin N synthase family dioxygenase [Acidihalobacter ferrooxydans]|uniref:2-oxoglutarate-dependent ethylene/succinate-forming enzyme n=1 Tax=Acidihalobacter ferrooxydans TaxID=1765967 RepID=A0A1P8UGL7_9GAMM|nr:2-oxoglutarate and iron-dependent oxygenase domain-containing protein [Acidihalobacter ferrooxydans]APZ42959.1 2OG-Fe(II) oxygenase [Acidihalobacter ferrooxydans]